ncbi:MAG: ABC transporter ATP-binding protein [Phycisphaeraceae bacterium]
MSRPAIQVNQLTKQYRIGVREQAATTFREAAVNSLLTPWRRLRAAGGHGNGHGVSEADSRFFALRDVNFHVQPGETVGIIGHNGAGKSTLLKILSRITEPTSGEVRLRGRVASLLEVGTGFHPELTGRENVYLNGAILGMKKAEIERNFDRIVAFAEVDRFLDTPVKRYSSGMYVRLAFAVAAHLEPEILIVDEVLAVGDAAFQKKCLGRMGSVAHAGRTVLFVSHNMGAVRALCRRAVWLHQGQARMDGPAAEVVDAYLRTLSTAHEGRIDVHESPRQHGWGDQLRITGVVLNDGEPVRHGEPLEARLEYQTTTEVTDASLGLGFATLDGVRLVTIDTDLEDERRVGLPAGRRGAVQLRIERFDLQPGSYLIDIGARSGDRYCLDYVGSCAQIDVLPGPKTPSTIMRGDGGVRMRGQWSWT